MNTIEEKKLYIFLGLVFVAVALGELSTLVKLKLSPSQTLDTLPKEIVQILGTDNLEERVTYYQELIKRVGIEEGQEALYRSGLPFTGETHLLNHVSGEYAYERYGNGALQHCKDYFLASCYHGVIIRVIAIEGVAALEETMAHCFEEGAPVAAQCAHAIGHGTVAWFGYENLTKGLQTCGTLAKKDSRFPLFNCHDGVFMENLWGIHEDGTPSEDRWIKDDDPYYPCTDPRIKEEWQSGCWSNQASVMYQQFEGNVQKVGEYCNAVPNDTHRNICFDNLARQIHPLTKGGLDKALSYCGFLPQDRVAECLVTITNADFSVGGRELPYEICASLPGQKEGCYQHIYSNIYLYHKNPDEQKSQCMRIQEKRFQTECISTLESYR